MGIFPGRYFLFVHLQFDIKVWFGEAVRYRRGKGGRGDGDSHEGYVKTVAV